MADLIMPKMSDAMEEGKILRWIKHPGDHVEKGDPIVEVETDKANVEIEATDSGVLGEIKAQEGDTVPIGTTIAVISAAGEIAGVKGGAVEAPPKEEAQPVEQKESEAKVEQPPTPEPKAEAQPAQPQAEAMPPVEIPPIEEGVKASPLARKVAQDEGVDLAHIDGTGPGGRIVESDVREFLQKQGKPEQPTMELEHAKPAPPPPPKAHIPQPLAARNIEVGHIWETVGKRMTQSKQTVPHFYVTMEVDMEEALQMREWFNASRPDEKQISVNDLIIKACAIALIKHPTLNASYVEGNKISMHDTVNIGIAVAIPDGLISPVVRNCESKSLSTISEEAKDLVRRTRKGEIRPEEYSGATFTVSNLGMYGVDEFLAIIVPPQAAILATGASIPQPVAMDGRVEIRQRMRITVSADHRVTDGARVAEFMRDLKHTLEHPMALLE